MTAVHRDQFTCDVIANVSLCREHYRLVLRLAEFPPTQPGQFIQLSCRDLQTDDAPQRELEWQPGLGSRELESHSGQAMLRRPFSLAGRRDTPQGVELDIIHRVVGVGTQWLSRLNVGNRAFILGPLGNRFTLPGGDRPAILVGGGVGIPPMLYLAEKLAGRAATAFCGALTQDLLPLAIRANTPAPGIDSCRPLMNIEEFARHGISSVISTDDGSYGFRGFVTQALEKHLDELGFVQFDPVEPAAGRAESGVQGTQEDDCASVSLPTLYTCGPEPMMKRVAAIAAARGLPCQIAVERAMACGMGTCQSCCIKVKKPVHATPLIGRDWAYRLACTDGPVFSGADLLW